MGDEESALDSTQLSPAEFVSQSIVRRFPQSTLEPAIEKSGESFVIHCKDRVLLKLDSKGVKYFFPTHRRRNIKWAKVTTAGLPRVVEYILRDLAEADYEVLSLAEKKISKRPIHISQYTRCPGCTVKGGLKVIFHGDSTDAENSEIYAFISREVEINGAELMCIHCEWMGIRKQLQRKSGKFTPSR